MHNPLFLCRLTNHESSWGPVPGCSVQANWKVGTLGMQTRMLMEGWIIFSCKDCGRWHSHNYSRTSMRNIRMIMMIVGNSIWGVSASATCNFYGFSSYAIEWQRVPLLIIIVTDHWSWEGVLYSRNWFVNVTLQGTKHIPGKRKLIFRSAWVRGYVSFQGYKLLMLHQVLSQSEPLQ